jgi:DNA-directed RNA polymerase beta' subunit
LHRYNADFDGDQWRSTCPSAEAQAEARFLMLSPTTS